MWYNIESKHRDTMYVIIPTILVRIGTEYAFLDIGNQVLSPKIKTYTCQQLLEGAPAARKVRF